MEQRPGGVELDELHVFERDPGMVGHGHPAAGVDDRIGGVDVRAADAAGGDDHRVAAEGLEAAADHVVRHHALADALVHDQPGHVLVDVELHLVPVGLLDQGVQQIVAGLVGAVAAPREARPAERPLGDAPVVDTG